MWNFLRSKTEKALDLLPWYINNSLGEKESRQVGTWLNSSKQALHNYRQLSRIASIVRDQQSPRVDPDVWRAVQQEIHRDLSSGRTWLSGVRFWVFAGLLTVLLLAVFWSLIEPGIALKWSVSGTVPDSFHVYRARLGDMHYQLLRVLHSQPGVSEYRYVDHYFAPISGYVYRVEGVGESGRIAMSQSVVAPPLPALLEQTAVLLASLVVSFTLTTAIEYSNCHRLVLANLLKLS